VFGVKWQCRVCGMVWEFASDSAGTPTCIDVFCAGTCDPVFELPNLATTAATGQTPVFIKLGASIGLDCPAVVPKRVHRKIRWEN
jgi:hypothetical protein